MLLSVDFFFKNDYNKCKNEILTPKSGRCHNASVLAAMEESIAIMRGKISVKDISY